MSDTRLHTRSNTGTTLRRIARITGRTLLAILVIVIGGMAFLSIYLTPQRLTSLINKEASSWLKADIRASNVRYTLWSSFPRLAVMTDSITITSRTLRGVSPEILRQLPADRDFLASLRSLKGEINILDFISGRYVVHNVHVDGLSINLVAYNDSINNYSIIPKNFSGFKKVPYVTANSISFTNSGKMDFFSVATGTSASMQLADLTLKRTHAAPLISRHHNDTYRMTMAGKITAVTDRLPILSDFPFMLNGNMTLRFDPFGVDLSNYAIDLGDVKGKLSMSVGIGENPSVDNFDYHLTTLNLMTLLGYLPAKYMPDLTVVKADLPVSASARLTSPWHFSSENLPSIDIRLHIPKGDVSYTLASSGSTPERTYTLTHSDLNGILKFNGNAPERSTFRLNPFRLLADGLDCTADATVSQLTDDPLFRISIDCDADIPKTLKYFTSYLTSSQKVSASGRLDAKALLNFRLSDFSGSSLAKGLYNIRAAADIRLADAAISIPASKVKTSTDYVRIRIGALADALTENSLSNSLFDATVDVGRSATTIGGDFLSTDGLRLTTKAYGHGALDGTALAKGLPIAVTLNAKDIKYSSRPDSFAVGVRNLHLTDSLFTSGNGAFIATASKGLRVSADTVTYKDANCSGIMSHPSALFNLTERKKIYTPASVRPSFTSTDNLPHTPEYLQVNAPAPIRRFLAKYDFNGRLKCPVITFASPDFLRGDRVRNLDMTFTPDMVHVGRLTTNIQSTDMQLSADVDRLRDFLLDTIGPRPLDIRMGVDLGVVNINELAHDWYMAHGGVPQKKANLEPTASDSVAMLVPRNINAVIDASAKETVYTNLHLYDLSTRLLLSGGKAAVKGLNISSDFGHGALDLTYDTSDIDHMGFKGNVTLTDVNIVNFFKNFHTLLLMEPEMKNLTGNISIYSTIGGDLFPDMVINAPALYADANLHGTGLKVHQSNFIRHITRMMLISNDDDLHIKDMDFYAHVHGNLLQLDPFLFEFDDYKLQMLGINNFDGELYYHVGILENPFHIPFSINIEGLFHHPELHFGGTHYDTRHAMRISQSVMEQNNVNIVAMMKNFIQEFLRKAAQAAEDPNFSL